MDEGIWPCSRVCHAVKLRGQCVLFPSWSPVPHTHGLLAAILGTAGANETLHCASEPLLGF